MQRTACSIHHAAKQTCSTQRATCGRCTHTARAHSPDPRMRCCAGARSGVRAGEYGSVQYLIHSSLVTVPAGKTTARFSWMHTRNLPAEGSVRTMAHLGRNFTHRRD